VFWARRGTAHIRCQARRRAINDAPGAVTGITFGQAQLVAKKWQLAFVVGNDLLADASVNVADCSSPLGGESLANIIDYRGFVGGAVRATRSSACRHNVADS
jgi:hypothetical protein